MIILCPRSIGDNTGIGADTAGVSTGQSDESCLSPSSSPGVLDLPVAADNTDKQDGVVDSGGAVAEHTASVGAPVGSIDGDRDGGVVDAARQAIAASMA